MMKQLSKGKPKAKPRNKNSEWYNSCNRMSRFLDFYSSKGLLFVLLCSMLRNPESVNKNTGIMVSVGPK
jgi:hypothetical protein